jgi:hypothetical protein
VDYQHALYAPVKDLAIKPLSKRRAAGKPHGVEEWLAYLKPLMGNEAQERYEEMLSRIIILLNPELFGAKTHYLKQVDQEILDFGMARISFAEKMVNGLKKGSRAEEAGLKAGDKIMRHSYLWRCVDHFEEKMELLADRDGWKSRLCTGQEVTKWLRAGRWLKKKPMRFRILYNI